MKVSLIHFLLMFVLTCVNIHSYLYYYFTTFYLCFHILFFFFLPYWGHKERKVSFDALEENVFLFPVCISNMR